MSGEGAAFDAIVVGAGPAGSMAAWRLATLGRRVALLERGAFPGAKNLFGGMVAAEAFARYFPGFAAEAPIERPVTRHSTHLLAGGRSLCLDFTCEPFGVEPYNGFTAYRSRLDRWLAERAVAAGALLVPATVADDLLWERGRVAGVVTRREQGALRAPVVIAADGVLSLLGQRAGLVPPHRPEHYSLGVREVLGLPARTIEERFQVDAQGGCAALFAGAWAPGVAGGGFLYTNRESLSLGFVVPLPALRRAGVSILEALEDFKRRPVVRRYIAGAERLEYGAHLVPEAGWGGIPRLAGDGILLAGDAAGLVLAGGVIYEGVNYAMHSGVLAAETAHEALARGDCSAAALRPYARRLRDSVVGRNLRTFRRVPRLLANPLLYGPLPEALCGAAEDFFRADGAGRPRLGRLLRRHLRPIGPVALLRLGWQTLRAWF